jgi:hypothetical protein
MDRIIFLLLILVRGFAVFAQSGVGIGTATPHASALIDLHSNTKGLLAPRMTSAQRNAISSPAKGLLVYDTDVNSLYHYNGSAWVNLSASGGGALTLPYTGSVAHAGVAFSITNTGAGGALTGVASANAVAAIQGTNSLGSGGYGVYGVSGSASGFGVGGANPTGVAVYGFSASGGTALRGISPSGLALNTSGNIRISGGNTSPSAGAVLTSVDASGNAVWKNNRIGFAAAGVNASYASVPHNTTRKVHFGSVGFYDVGQNFNLLTTTVEPTSSSFTAPVTGGYHFDVKVRLSSYILEDPTEITGGLLTLKRNRGGVITNLGYDGTPIINIENIGLAEIVFSLSRDLLLQSGDIIYVEVIQYNDDGRALFIGDFNDTWFNGHLIFQQL